MLPRFFFLFLVFQLGLSSYAQTTALATRNISSVLYDSLRKPIEGARIRLVSDKDTLQTSTNKFGYWRLLNVKSPNFLLSIHGLGHAAFHRKYFINDTKQEIQLPVVLLGENVNKLEEINIKRVKGPVVKGDTTEFWASDYIIRDYARLEDLLRRMEGIEIKKDGTVTYNGQEIVKALFNNETYFQGSVQEAMKELPADIVERIQIIERDKTGTHAKINKADEGAKVLNIVTKPDKSAGKMLNIIAQHGSQSRYTGQFMLKNIDAYNQFSGQADFQQYPLGLRKNTELGSISNRLPSTLPSEGVSAGEAKKGTINLSKSVKIGEELLLVPRYQSSLTYNNQQYAKYGESFLQDGSFLAQDDSKSSSDNQDHNLNLVYHYSNKKSGLIHGDMGFGLLKTQTEAQKISQRSGLVNSLEETAEKDELTNYKLSFGTTHLIHVGKFTSNSNLRTNLTQSRNEGDLLTSIFQHNATTADSSVHQQRDNKKREFNVYFQNQLQWRFTKKFKSTLNTTLTARNGLNDLKAYQLDEELLATYSPKWSNYFLSNKIAIPVRFMMEYTFDNGIFISPDIRYEAQWIHGKVNRNLNRIHRNDHFINPGLSAGYINPKLGSIRVSYQPTYKQPELLQLNPDSIFQTPFSVRVGNMNLKNSFSQQFNFQYSHFFPRLKFNVSGMSFNRFTTNEVVNSQYVHIDEAKGVVYNTLSFTNLDGARQSNNQINLAKNITKFNSSIRYIGSLQLIKSPFLQENQLYSFSSELQSHTLSFQLTPAKWVDLSPSYQFERNKDNNSLMLEGPAIVNTFQTAGMDAQFYLPFELQIRTFVGSYTQDFALTARKSHRWIINANVEKRLFKKKDAMLSLLLMDALRENGEIAYQGSSRGYSTMKTNSNSRYVLVQFSWQPQIWTKSRYDKGKGRQGDGTFIP